MSQFPMRAFEPENIHVNVIWGFIFLGVGEGIRLLLKHRHKFNKIAFQKTLCWFGFICHMSFSIVLSYNSIFFNKIHLKRISLKLDKIVFREMWKGLWSFFKTDPIFAYKIFKVIKKANESLEIGSITGVYSDFDSEVKEAIEDEDEIESNLLPELEKILYKT